MLATALDAHAGDATILSLDCFDTLVWRTGHQPVDVFAALGPNARIHARVKAESDTRKAQRLRNRSNEVSLREIYARLLDDPGDEARERAVQAELAAEAAHCFGFAPAIELIRNARARGMRVIVVSDTYLGSDELRTLIAGAAGADVASMIERVFCSNEHGVSKADGLFRFVLDALGVPPGSLLHLGDNPAADLQAPRRLGIRAVHIEQFPTELGHQLRQEAALASVIDPGLRTRKPFLQVHRAPLATAWQRADTPAHRIGLGTLGPILYGFAHWIASEVESLQRQGKKIVPLFLLRDAHLPHLVFERVAPHLTASTRRVEISRFTAFAASMRTTDDVIDYCAGVIDSGRFEAIAAQLLFSRSESEALARRARACADPAEAFGTEITRAKNLKLIAERSSAFAQRMYRYLREHAGVREGDTLMLVDLGYAGTVQDRIAPVLRTELGVDVVGRYLLLRDVASGETQKSGFIGPDHYDARSLDALASHVAILEQLCTSEQASAVGFDDAGNVLRKSADLKARQSEVRTLAQRACLDYCEAFLSAYPVPPVSLDVDALRQGACAALTRLLFLPSSDELGAFDEFEHDINMGVDDKVRLFDPAAAHDAMIRRGLACAQDNPRQFLPAELRGEGIEVSLTLLAMRRFGLDLRHADCGAGAIEIPVLLAATNEATQAVVRARPTHDGWYVAAIPLGSGRYAVGLRLGAAFEWLQVHAVGLTRSDSLMTTDDLDRERDVSSMLVPEGFEQHASGLMRCASEEAFLFFPPLGDDGVDAVLTIVFRPIATRVALPATEVGDEARTLRNTSTLTA